MWESSTGRSQRKEIMARPGKRKKALWLEASRLREGRACCLCGLCWLGSSPLAECSFPSLIHPSHWFLIFLHLLPRHFPTVIIYDKVNLTLEQEWGTQTWRAHLAKPQVQCFLQPDDTTEKSFPGVLRTHLAADAAISTELKMSRRLNCQRLELERRVHWHIDSQGHLALDYLLAGKPAYAIPYIFLHFNEVINAIRSDENINVRKHVA